MFFKRLTSLVGMALWAGLSLCAQDVRISYEAVGKNYLLKAIILLIIPTQFRLCLRNLRVLRL